MHVGVRQILKHRVNVLDHNNNTSSRAYIPTVSPKLSANEVRNFVEI